jgi:hypothetical protein
METAVTSVERKESRNTSMTRTAKARPSRPSVVSPSMDCRMEGASSETTASSAPSPSFDSRSGILS